MAERPRIAAAWLRPDYRAALEKAGADVVELLPSDVLPAALEACDGLLLTGGVDVDPAHYGEAERHPTVNVDPERDRYELALARFALARDVPTLAICRGAQVLNVAAGGSLIQDIPASLAQALSHDRTETKTTLAHEIRVEPGSGLAGLLAGVSSVPVNSRHHQSMREVAPDFVISATADDGVIEAIENPSARFCLGVQWHPENFWRTGEFDGLFTGLVDAARQARATARPARQTPPPPRRAGYSETDRSR